VNSEPGPMSRGSTRSTRHWDTGTPVRPLLLSLAASSLDRTKPTRVAQDRLCGGLGSEMMQERWGTQMLERGYYAYALAVHFSKILIMRVQYEPEESWTVGKLDRRKAGQ